MSTATRDMGGAMAASAVATATDGVVFFTLVGLGTQAGIGALFAAAAGAVTHYSLSRFGVFRRFEAPLLRSAVSYMIMSSGAAAVYAVGAQLAVPFVGAVAAWIMLKTVIFVAITYPLSRYWVFAQRANA